MIQAEVTGIEELKDRLNKLAYAGASRASSKGIRAGLKVLEKAQKAAAPVGKTGALKARIGSRFLKSGKGRQRGVQTAKAGINVGRKRTKVGEEAKGRDKAYAPHSHLVALGTQPRWAGIVYGRTKRRGQKSEYNPKADKFSDKINGKNLKGKARYTGIMPANPFVRVSSQAAEAQAIEAVRTTTLEAIAAEVAKR